MKTSFLPLLALASLLFFFACTPEEPPLVPTDTCEAILVGENSFLNADRDPFQFKTAVIDTNCLELVVNYGGGCGIANFELVYFGSLGEGNPRVAPLVLSFDDQDPCEAARDTTLRFSLIGLQDSNFTQIALDIEGYTPASPLIYTYE